jgi:hypothetical protein
VPRLIERAGHKGSNFTSPSSEKVERAETNSRGRDQLQNPCSV